MHKREDCSIDLTATIAKLALMFVLAIAYQLLAISY
jgi:hypothetical protein